MKTLGSKDAHPLMWESLEMVNRYGLDVPKADRCMGERCLRGDSSSLGLMVSRVRTEHELKRLATTWP
jgi:hypothetical protein